VELEDRSFSTTRISTPLRFAHRLITSFCVARRFDVKAHGNIVYNPMDIEIAFAHFAS
jgi:hypothetical protein